MKVLVIGAGHVGGAAVEALRARGHEVVVATRSSTPPVDARDPQSIAALFGAIGTVDAVEGRRIKLIKADSGQGSHEGHHHYVSVGLVADVEGDTVRLSANAAVAVQFQEEENETQGG